MSLIDWMGDDDDGTMHFYSQGKWGDASFDELARSVSGAAELLTDAGVTRGDRVALVLPTGFDFFNYFFGAIAIGAVPTALPSPGIGGRQFCGSHVVPMLRTLAPRLVVATAGTLDLLDESIRSLGLIPLASETPIPDSGFTRAFAPNTGSETAVIQFTSGSTSAPRGVVLTADAVQRYMTIVKSIFHRGGRVGYSFGSWLPMHHDMGLIGMFMFAACFRTDGWFMPPEVFVRRPLEWLSLFSEKGVNHSAIPNFAVERVIQVLKPEMLAGYDFSNWRTLIIGSDRINFHAMRQFYEMLAPYGFGCNVLKPGYGMAETTLGVTTARLDSVLNAIAIDDEPSGSGQPVRIRGEYSLTDPLPDSDISGDSLYVVSCGADLPEMRSRIVDAAGSVLPDRCVGEIVVQSPALFAGYLGKPATKSMSYATGDLGLKWKGELYVLGRVGNSVKVNGGFVTAEDIEVLVATRVGLTQAKVTVVLRDLSGFGRPMTLLVIQQKVHESAVPAICEALIKNGLSADHAAVVVVAPRAIARTTSGKPKRAEIWSGLASGRTKGRFLFIGERSVFHAEQEVLQA
ncbi:AMP-binding protein [Nocardia sp. NPDC058114]|uniref:AMP-binding protein n=1 Tax=Nocardia sp. NPDC058114 TaxID=3346346 RepID=UPI0036D805A8